MDNSGLVHQLRMLHAGAGDPSAVVTAFRSSVVYVPQTADGLTWTTDQDGVRWIQAFSSEAELASFAQARGWAEPELPYLTVQGWRLLDVAVPALGRPGGVALDAAGQWPMLFPPVRGIVPDEVAVDGRES